MKDAYLERKNNPEVILPEDMSDEEYLKYMSTRFDKDQEGWCRRYFKNLRGYLETVCLCEELSGGFLQDIIRQVSWSFLERGIIEFVLMMD